MSETTIVDIYENRRSVSELSRNICSTYVSSGFGENRFSSIKLYTALIQDCFNRNPNYSVSFRYAFFMKYSSLLFLFIWVRISFDILSVRFIMQLLFIHYFNCRILDFYIGETLLIPIFLKLLFD